MNESKLPRRVGAIDTMPKPVIYDDSNANAYIFCYQ